MNCFPLTRAEFDVTDRDRARSFLSELRPEMIVNTTAFHRVDDCETKAELAYDVNVLSVLNLVRSQTISMQRWFNSAAIMFSTGQAEYAYNEDSVALPLSIYGNSRLAGELLVRTMARRYFLIRTCGFMAAPDRVARREGTLSRSCWQRQKTAIAIRVVNDQTLTPTATLDLARQLSVLLKTSEYGLYHATCSGECTWFEFAAAILKLPESKQIFRRRHRRFTKRRQSGRSTLFSKTPDCSGSV
jgi:dTDP-4-dehydrorhamnose reductase